MRSHAISLARRYLDGAIPATEFRLSLALELSSDLVPEPDLIWLADILADQPHRPTKESKL